MSVVRSSILVGNYAPAVARGGSNQLDTIVVRRRAAGISRDRA